MMQKKAKNLNGNAIQKKRNGNRTRRRNTQQEEQNNVAFKIFFIERNIFKYIISNFLLLISFLACSDKYMWSG